MKVIGLMVKERTGIGSFCFGEGPWKGQTYNGDWADGNKHGKGVYRWPNGDSYEGDWVNGKRTGRGVFRWPNGNIYDGDFLDSKMSSGQMFLADASLNLAAEFSGGDEVDGYKLYRLVLKNPDGSVYREGDFSNGRFV